MGVFRWLMQALHVASCLLLIGLMILTVGDVAGRYLFNRPITGTYELTGLFAALAVFLGFGFAHVAKEHITIDLLYSAVGPRIRRALDVFATVVTVGAVIALALGLRHYAGRMDSGGYTTSVLKVPIGPFVWGAVLGTIAYGVAAAGDLVEFARSLVGQAAEKTPVEGVGRAPAVANEGGQLTRDP